MLKSFNPENILFIDIETVPLSPSFSMLPATYQKLWEKKSALLKHVEGESPETLYERAGIYAEFGKVICVSTAWLHNGIITCRSFYGDNELTLLAAFNSFLKEFFGKREQILCAHNGKEFDFPYLSRRMLINGIELPAGLDIAGKKPWEVNLLDTMELWKFGDYKSYTSLALLTAVFNIPSPKDDIDGSDVGRVYWQEHDIDRIARYCEKDAVAVVQLFLKYQGRNIIPAESIIIA
ncbi:MAG: 3'-5' exonuclease [Bacteroidota bacterium]